MKTKTKEKERAIALRRQGYSYSEILKEVKVAKSTIALWLQSVGLSKRQQRRLTEKKLASARRGGLVRHKQRLELVEGIYDKAEGEIGIVSQRELWLMGVMLYWAEGTKEKDYRPGSGVQFSNSDPKMINFFLRWLRDIVNIPAHDIYFDIFIHENSRNRVGVVRHYWMGITGFGEQYFQHVYFKKGNPKTKRKNIGDGYFGVVKVRVRESSGLVRRIAGWVNGVVQCL